MHCARSAENDGRLAHQDGVAVEARHGRYTAAVALHERSHLGDPMNLYLATALMLFGICAHFLTVLSELEEAGTSMTPLAYLKQHPYRAASMAVCAFILLLAANAAGELTHLSAVLIGFSCQTAADQLR